MSLFLLTFFLVYGATHAYAFLKARAAIGPGWAPSLALGLLFALLLCGPLLVHLLGERGFEGLSRAASWIAYIWMGLLFFFTWTNLVLDGGNLAWRLGSFLAGRGFVPLVPWGRTAFFAMAGLAVALGVYSLAEADRIRTRHVVVRTDKLPPGTERIRIAQVSDVHFGLLVRERKAARIALLVSAAKPDLFVSTGDLVDARINHLDGLSGILQGIRAPLGKYLVTGNHEFYAGIGPALEFGRRSGFTVLRGETAEPGGILRIAGVDDPAGAMLGAKPARTEGELLSGPSPPLFTLLLKHRPELARGSAGRFDLQLSGHTHDGQIYPFRLLTRMVYPLLAGLHEIREGGAVYVSRGTGTWGPPMRFLAPPEVTIIDIERRV